ncbi:MAG: hypothetical protein ACOCSN_00045 [Halanaeroarchaeum sp.]
MAEQTSADAAARESSEGEMAFETVERWRRGQEDAVDPEQFLFDVDAVTPVDDGQDLATTDGFADLVTDHLAALEDGDPDRSTLAEMYGTDPDDVERKDRAYPAIKVGRRIRKWPSEGALRLDVASHRALDERTDQWMAVPPEQRIAILESLRSFREQCPVCGGDVAFEESVVESCCATYEVLAYGCTDCGERLLELDPSALDGGDDTLTGCQP